MANKGLKSYTKQISGTISDVVKYSVNVNDSDGNMNLIIPLLKTISNHPIELELIYNHQRRNAFNQFGKGMLTNYGIIINDHDSWLDVINADGSSDIYNYDDNTNKYISQTTTKTIRKDAYPVDGDSDEYGYTITDKNGNIISIKDFSYYPNSINLINGANISFSTNTITNNIGSTITYTYTNNLVTKITYKESNISTSINIDLEYDTNNRINRIRKYIVSNLVSDISINYSDSLISVLDNFSKHNVLFNLNNNKVISIQEKYLDGLNTLYTISYSNNQSIITDSLGNTNTIVFDEDNLPSFEYDNNYTLSETDYDSKTKRLLSQNIDINIMKLEDNNIIESPYDYEDKFVILSEDAEISRHSTMDQFLTTIGMKSMYRLYTHSSGQRLFYRLYKKGLPFENLTLILFGKNSSNNKNVDDVKVILETYSNGNTCDRIEGRFSSVFKNRFDLLTLGLITTAPYDYLDIEFELSDNVVLDISNMLLVNKEYGSLFTYDEYQNITSVINSSNKISYTYNEDNFLVSKLDNNGKYKYEYDNKGNITNISSNDINISNTYDQYNNLTEQIIESNNCIIKNNNIYDSYGNLLTTVDTFNKTISYQYEMTKYGRIKKIIDLLSITELFYNNNERISKKIYKDKNNQSNNCELLYTYNSNMDIETVKASNDSIYQFIYDNNSNITNIKVNDVIIYTYTYDSNNRITSVKYASDTKLYEFEYNNQDSLTNIKYNGSVIVLYEYNDYLELITINNIRESIKYMYEYDDNSRICKVEEYRNNVLKNTILYTYDHLGLPILERITNENYHIVNTNDSISRSTASNPELLFNTYVKNNCMTCFFDKDINLRSLYEMRLGYNAYNSNIKIVPNKMSVTINKMNRLSYSISNENMNYGGVAFWFNTNTIANDICIFNAGSIRGNGNLYANINSNNNIVIKYDNGVSINTILTTSNSVNTNWNFIGIIWNSNGIYINLNGIEQYKTLTQAITLSVGAYSNIIYNIAHSNNELSNSFWCDIKGLMTIYKEPLISDQIKLFYLETKEYLFPKKIEEDGLELSNYSLVTTRTFDSIKNNQFDIFPLNNTLESIKGLKPTLFSLKGINNDKDRIFDYNNDIKRYVYSAWGNILEYKLALSSSHTYGMNIYLNHSTDKQYILYLYNDTSNIGLFINNLKYIFYEVNGVTYSTGLSLSINHWHFISLSYYYNTSRQTLKIRIVLDSLVREYSISTQASYSISNIVLGRKKTEVISRCLNEKTNYPLYGQIESFFHRASYCDESIINLMKEAMKPVSKINYYNELGSIKKLDVRENNSSIISNVINYKEYNNKEVPLEVESEIIKFGNSVSNRQYTFTNNNITNITDTIFGNKTYNYDYRGYLINDNGISITYDDNGNILSYGNNIFTYDSIIKDRLVSVNGKSIGYLSTNPLTPRSYDGNIYSYEGRRLISITSNGEYENTSINYTYDNNGLRLKKSYVIDYSDDRDSESETHYFYYNNEQLITDYVSDNDRLDFLYDSNGLLYGFIHNKNTKYYYIRDIMQNILGIIDTNGNLVVKYNYNAYGNVSINDDGSYTLNSFIANRNPFRYKGYYYDNESGMYYCKSRYYVPKWCRWLNADSISYLDPESIGGLNLYCYCYNDPVMYSDGSGHFAISALVIGAIIGACIGFGTAAYVDSKDGQMFNGDVKWYDYLGATALGGLAGAGLGAFATTTFAASIPTLGLVNSGGALTLGVTGSIELAISGAQILTGVGAAGLVIMMSKPVGKYGGYEVRHNYPNDHQPPHVHIYGDDIHRGSHGIRVGLDGNPLKGEPELSPGARRAIRKLMDAIAKALMPWKG